MFSASVTIGRLYLGCGIYPPPTNNEKMSWFFFSAPLGVRFGRGWHFTVSWLWMSRPDAAVGEGRKE